MSAMHGWRRRNVAAVVCSGIVCVGVVVGGAGAGSASVLPARASASHLSGVAWQLEMAAKAHDPGCAVDATSKS
jgi:hypothetical protein